MRIVIFGAGGVGGFFGACLARGGAQVAFVARGEHLRAMKSDGLRVFTPDGDFQVRKIEASDDPVGVAPADLLLLTVKAWQVDAAQEALGCLLKPDGVVLPLLNGIETPDRLAALLGRRRVLKGLTRIVSHISAPGCITHVGVEPTILFKEPDNTTSDRTMAILDLLAGAGIRARLPDDIDVALWEKFLFVTSVGGVGALSRAPLGVLREMPETRALLQEAMAEVAVLAGARGTTLRPDAVTRAMEFLDGMPVDATASLQRDIMAGRRSELEAWSGAIVRLSRQAGVSTPVHEVIYRSLLPLEQRASGGVSFT